MSEAKRICGVVGCSKEASDPIGGAQFSLYEAIIKVDMYACEEHQEQIQRMIETAGGQGKFHITTIHKNEVNDE